MVHVRLEKLITEEQQEIGAHLLVLAHGNAGVHTQLSLSHRVSVSVHEELLQVGFGFLVVNVDLPRDGLETVHH